MPPSQTQILADIDAVFGDAPKPAHFTDYRHCEECAEHDRLLIERDRASLKIEDVGSPGWDPLCFCSPEGLAYYMPSLARLALAPPTYRYGWYAEQLLFHFINQGLDNPFLKFCDARQRRAVVALLQCLDMIGSKDGSYNLDDFIVAIELWSDRRSADTD